jgi:arginine decarboxylase
VGKEMFIQPPANYFFAKGHAEGYMELNAFDAALLDAGIGNTNLVKMSSILPPGCLQIQPLPLPPGCLVPVAYSAITCRRGRCRSRGPIQTRAYHGVFGLRSL